MKVAELIGALLDYWVARAEDYPLSCDWDQGDYILIGTGAGDLEQFAPSTDWSDGGPIIERARIDLKAPPNMDAPDEHVDWAASVPDPNVAYTREYFGETPLIAAMRAYVASKFGDDVAPKNI
ncbi:DUF2591 domain-containing protein [Burkholderia gladioli]|uniref:DUF2591 domain-containing protein n=1 Tax=Burkholderia gladioli TaxID=28095 RepID=UPI00163E2DDF|nr:DUF2591 domain-containing protein [Burkholderia gladioli]